MDYLYTYFVIINAVGFLFMLIDKQKAKKKKWRIPERTLMAFAAAGGSLGVLMGMFFFRHKTKHPKFVIGVPLLMMMHIIIALAAYHI
ncbi:MAG: DUF1294 domain-containing protein [Ruminococcaceae bacterium]|nr:DUF1294 domain-containing protein [Oscillospiraceae bacterium]